MIEIHPKSIERYMARIRELTSRHRGVKKSLVLSETVSYQHGWGGHFVSLTECPRVLTKLDKWVRRRLRQYLWVQWKTSRNRYRNLIKGGVDPLRAKIAAGRVGPWKASGSPALQSCLSNAVLTRAGFVGLADLYARKASL